MRQIEHMYEPAGAGRGQGYLDVGSKAWPATEGCREHVSLIAWHDRDRQRLVITGEVVDELTEPGTLRYELLIAVESGPFLASADLEAAGRQIIEWCQRHWGYLS